MLADVGRVSIEQNRRVATVFSEAGYTVPGYVALPLAPPLCFMHIPKTGGASTILWLESMFHADELAPCRNYSDFESLAGLKHSYRLFAGHFIGRQAGLFPPEAQWMTVLRDPVEMAVSAYHHRRLAPENDWNEARAYLPAGDPLRGNDADEKSLAERMSALFREMDLLTAMQRRLPEMRPFFRDNLARRFGATEAEDRITSDYDDRAPELQRIREQQWSRASQLLDSIDLVGDHSNLNEFLLLVAASRGWPAPPSLARLHDFGAPTRSDAKDPELREQFQDYSPMDDRIYARARLVSDKVADRLQELCGGTTPQHVDRHHRLRFFAEAKPVLGFDVTADEAWNGIGWGMRERDGMRNAFRQIANGRDATMLVRLDPSIAEYRVFIHFWHASNQSAIDGFAVHVTEVPLERVGEAWRSGAYIVEWRLPAALIASTRGQIEFGFEKASDTVHESVSIARIGCVPALTFA